MRTGIAFLCTSFHHTAFATVLFSRLHFRSMHAAIHAHVPCYAPVYWLCIEGMSLGALHNEPMICVKRSIHTSRRYFLRWHDLYAVCTRPSRCSRSTGLVGKVLIKSPCNALWIFLRLCCAPARVGVPSFEKGPS